LGPWYRLILLTGDRRGEWARARWDWLDPDRTRLEIPASEYKTGKPQVVPLSGQARAILDMLPHSGAGPFLFSSDGGARPVSGFSKAKARLDRALADRLGPPLPPWVVHDLRRSMATHMERIGVAPHVIEVCLGHVLKAWRAPTASMATCPRRPRPCSAGRTNCWGHQVMLSERATEVGTAAPAAAA
jgi:integrase